MSITENDAEQDQVGSVQIELLTKELLYERIKDLPESYTGNKPLDLSGLGIRKLEDLTEFTKLNRLNLANNYLESLRFVSPCTELTTLNVSHNNLSGKGLRGIVTLEHLTVLNASFNRIKKIPPFVFEALQKLKALILNNNQIRDLSFLIHIKTLNTLILSHNEITDGVLQYTYLEPMIALRKLSIAYNSLTTLQLPVLQNLHELNLSHNRITVIPESILNLPKLFLLDISYNQISDLTEIEKLKSISSLHQLIYNDNPFENESVTIQTIQEMIPQLTHINRVVSEEYTQRKIQRKRQYEEQKNKIQEEREAKRKRKEERKNHPKTKNTKDTQPQINHSHSVENQKKKHKVTKSSPLQKKTELPPKEGPKRKKNTTETPIQKMPKKSLQTKENTAEKKEKETSTTPSAESIPVQNNDTGVISIETKKRSTQPSTSSGDVLSELMSTTPDLSGWD